MLWRGKNMLGLSPLFGEVSGSQTLGHLPVCKAGRLGRKILPSLIALTAFTVSASAQGMVELPLIGKTTISTLGAVQFAIFAGVMGAAFLSAIGLIRLR